MGGSVFTTQKLAVWLQLRLPSPAAPGRTRKVGCDSVTPEHLLRSLLFLIRQFPGGNSLTLPWKNLRAAVLVMLVVLSGPYIPTVALKVFQPRSVPSTICFLSIVPSLVRDNSRHFGCETSETLLFFFSCPLASKCLFLHELNGAFLISKAFMTFLRLILTTEMQHLLLLLQRL